MRLSALPSGTEIVDRHGHRWQVVGAASVDKDRRVDPDDAERLGLRAAFGNNRGHLTAQLIGRPQARSDGRHHGLLARRIAWTGQPRTGVALIVSGHDLVDVDTFARRWAEGQRVELRVAAVRYEGNAKPAHRRPLPCVVVTDPDPYAGDDRRWPTTSSFSSPVAVDGHVTVTADKDTAPDVWGRLGPFTGGVDVTVETADGTRYVADVRCVVADPHGIHLNTARKKTAEAHTQGPRDRMGDALRALARGVEADPGKVRVGVDDVTVPHPVLEALVLGDEHATAAVLDAIAELTDLLTELRQDR